MGRGYNGTRGASGGSTKSTSSASGGKISASKIDRTPFTSDGLGEWEIDIPGAGGGQILLNDNYGRYNSYETTFWDSDYKMSEKKEFATLNAAKEYIKDEIKKKL